MPQQKNAPRDADNPGDDGDDSARADDETAAGEAQEQQGDEAAGRVAEALGVGDAEAGESDDETQKDEAARPNRAARRREEALERRRRKKRGATADTASDDDDDEIDLSKDRNLRAKELLKRRREQAAERRPVALLPSEMVDDALARSTAAIWKWLRNNFYILQWIIIGVIAVTGGALFYMSRAETKAGTASSALADAIHAERGKVMAEDKRSEEEKEFDPSKVFKTAEERTEQALQAYHQVIDQYPGTGAAILAKLGEAGMLLEKKDYANALAAYESVLASPLAAADLDVKGRTLEGIGFAKEGSGDLDGALAAFKDMGGIDIKGYKEMSMYHQARILLAKGDKDKAKELLANVHQLLQSAREKAQAPGADTQVFFYLGFVVNELLHQIDPTAASAPTPVPGDPGGSSQVDTEKLLQRLREMAEKKEAAQADGGTEADGTTGAGGTAHE